MYHTHIIPDKRINRIMSVYFDHNATTAMHEAVLDAMLPYLREEFGNPSSRHALGIRARQAINRAREQVAAAVDVQPVQVVFNSSGSEANNLFIQGAASYLKPSQLIISAIEHPCVLRPAQELARKSEEKWTLHKLAVNHAGQVRVDDADIALSAHKTGLVSIMLANNETGVIQDIAAIAAKAKEHGAWVHTDAVQAFGKIPVSFSALNVHALTLSSHKICGPKGAAALIMDKRLLLKPLIFGGGHENGLRSGTENVAAIVGFGMACELASQQLTERGTYLAALRQRLEQGLGQMGATIFGAEAQRLPNTCYFALPDIEGDTMVVQLDQAGFAVASGAACSSVNPGKSHVLEAMGVDPMLARCAVRISLGNANTMAQVEAFLEAAAHIVKKLRNLGALTV